MAFDICGKANRRRLRLCVLVLVAAPAACSTPAALRDNAAGPGCIEQFDPNRDYFPEKTSIEFAENFSVEYRRFYKVVTVHRPSEGGSPESYILLQCGAPQPEAPETPADAPIVRIPVRSLFSSAATQPPLLADLGHVEALAGVAQKRYITGEAIREWMRRANVVEFAANEVTDAELVISKFPDVFMAGGFYPETYAAIRRAGIPIVANAEWLEPTALGRAEWLKYMALFLNEERRAQEQFEAVRDRYIALTARARAIPEARRPLVMTGTVYRGVFQIAGGRSYAAKLIADAGARYAWADNEALGGEAVSLESQIARASGAEFWINGGEWDSLSAMLQEERRYGEFRAFQRGNVWLYNRRLNGEGGNDYWSRGPARPDLILADLIKIFHPELAEDHEFMWYAQVPAE